MTGQEFMERVQKYYGKYEYVVADEVSDWLREKNPTGKQIDALWAELRDSHSNQYGKPPDVALIRKAWREVGRVIPEHKFITDESKEDLVDPAKVARVIAMVLAGKKMKAEEVMEEMQ